MKWVMHLMLFMVISVPGWGRSMGEQFSDHKPYVEMDAHELRQEEQRIRKLLFDIGAKLAGYPASDRSAPGETKASGDTDAFGDDIETLGRNTSAQSGRILREAHKRTGSRAQGFVLKDEVDKVEKEYREEQKRRANQRQKDSDRAYFYDYNNERHYQEDKAGLLKEYVIELPLASDNKNRKKEKVNVKLRSGIIPLIKKKQALDQQLIDSVVRLTGKSLKQP